MPDVSLHDLSTLSAAQRAQLLVRSEADLGPIIEKVKPIIAAVKAEGDEALARFARQFDKAPVTPERTPAMPGDFTAAFDAVDSEVVAAIEYAVDGIRRFHEAQ